MSCVVVFYPNEKSICALNVIYCIRFKEWVALALTMLTLIEFSGKVDAD